MGFHEFSDRLMKLKEEFLKLKGKEMTTVNELEEFINKRLIVRSSRGAKSLKGII